MRQLLGQERLHAVFDAGQSLDVEALAALCGALRAGSWLLLLTPPAAMAAAAGRRQPALERLPAAITTRISSTICNSIWSTTEK